MRSAGIVLAGGRSKRMGAPKAALEWHGSTLLARTAGVLARSVDGPVVVVGAPDQELPDVGAEVVRDPVEGRGPLQGIGAGLAAVAGRAERAFVCSVDLPFLHPAYVRAVLRALTPGIDVALPVVGGHHQPLAAAYRTALASRIDALLTAGRMRPAMLFAEVEVRRLGRGDLLADAELAAADPRLASLDDVDSPEQYRVARAVEPPEVAVGTARVRAATPAGAAALLGLPALRLVDGPDGPDVPLVAGDELR
ncbi:molybdenum cofactor guanylyltransferase [Pseudonocardia sp.]|uniref:molybdenum cofactor guanylyltransferase n=1 Tax=Pseudonocardia sp. TaxID=60912 RepID=UPI003D0D2B50